MDTVIDKKMKRFLHYTLLKNKKKPCNLQSSIKNLFQKSMKAATAAKSGYS